MVYNYAEQIFLGITSILNVFGPILIYVPQYYLMSKNKKIGSFSTMICYILIVAHTMRLVFRTNNPFDFSLLAQSVVTILCQLLLLNKCLRIENQKSGRKILTLLAFIAALYLVMVCLFSLKGAVDFSGDLSAMIEACLPLPQFISNCRNRSVESVSRLMIAFWVVGDASKLVFMLEKKQPLPFAVGAAFMLLFDLFILVQFYVYSASNLSIKHDIAHFKKEMMDNEATLKDDSESTIDATNHSSIN